VCCAALVERSEGTHRWPLCIESSVQKYLLSSTVQDVYYQVETGVLLFFFLVLATVPQQCCYSTIAQWHGVSGGAALLG